MRGRREDSALHLTHIRFTLSEAGRRLANGRRATEFTRAATPLSLTSHFLPVNCQRSKAEHWEPHNYTSIHPMHMDEASTCNETDNSVGYTLRTGTLVCHTFDSRRVPLS
ncbi:unnamed protein product [Pleuronectes platessa]|uniref:Uncharacterized protein n=1 Tax=Pleuronectes platessa TaxID=8262 RepID=A0A9N7TUQ0_PLEPL|nr:unnamed protein product [Pleuronectes platessa]